MNKSFIWNGSHFHLIIKKYDFDDGGIKYICFLQHLFSI